MYLETVDWATSNPSISSSPWIRDAPHSRFSLLIRWMRSRRPRSILGRPALFLDFHRQNTLKPARCQRRKGERPRDPPRAATEGGGPGMAHQEGQRPTPPEKSKTRRWPPQSNAE